MTSPEIEVDQELAVRAAEVAASRGETVEDVILRSLRTYVNPSAPATNLERKLG